MNLSLRETLGGALVVSQFTLSADVRKGNCPSFIGAAPPEVAEPSVRAFLRPAAATRACRSRPARFAAHMAVRLTNDGPVTIWLDSAVLPRRPLARIIHRARRWAWSGDAAGRREAYERRSLLLLRSRGLVLVGCVRLQHISAMVASLDAQTLFLIKAFGVLFALVGLGLLIYREVRRGPGREEQIAEFLGMKFRFSSTGMVVFLTGAVFMLTPLFVSVSPSPATRTRPLWPRRAAWGRRIARRVGRWSRTIT